MQAVLNWVEGRDRATHQVAQHGKHEEARQHVPVDFSQHLGLVHLVHICSGHAHHLRLVAPR